MSDPDASGMKNPPGTGNSSRREWSDLDLGETLRGFRVGQRLFDRFTLQQLLGRGGMGVVWLAQDEKLRRSIALKFLPEQFMRDALALDDLRTETSRALELTHPHIVRVYDVVEDSSRGIAAISMEYVDGDNLSNMRAVKPHRWFEPDEMREWIRQLCEALDYAHRRARVVHRDLKPANLMVNSLGELKVADFGVARSLIDSATRLSTGAHTSGGTLVYMSPQQALGQRAVAADDIYSLGATLYDLLTGRPPFYQGNIYEQVRSIAAPSIAERRKELREIDAAIPPAWEATIAACLAKEPADRPASAGEVWERLNGAAPSPRQPATPADPAGKSSAPEVIRVARRQTRAVRPAMIAATALAFAAAGGAWWWEQKEAAQQQAVQTAVAAQVAQHQAAAEAQRVAKAAADAEAKHQQELALAAAKEKADAERQQKIDGILKTARDHLFAERFEESRTAYREVLAIDAENGQAKSGLIGVDETEKAAKDKQAQMKKEAEHSMAVQDIAKARAALLQKDIGLAESFVIDALRYSPDEPEALKLRDEIAQARAKLVAATPTPTPKPKTTAKTSTTKSKPKEDEGLRSSPAVSRPAPTYRAPSPSFERPTMAPAPRPMPTYVAPPAPRPAPQPFAPSAISAPRPRP